MTFRYKYAPVICMTGIVLPHVAAAQETASQTKSPHIILIMTDQQRADAMGCAGNETVITPNLDRLAAEGHRFCSAYTAAPSSTPARAGLLTGQSPWHHGMLGYGQVAEKYPFEMPHMLAQLGYHTMGIGKMHWYPQTTRHGFEATLLDESGRVESPGFMSDYRKWFCTQAFGMNPDSTGIGWNDHAAGIYSLPERLHPTVWTGDMAVETINGYASDRPLFLKVSFARPHSPYDPPKRLVDMYEGRDIPAPVVGEWCELLQPNMHPESNPDAPRGNFGVDYARRSRRYYYAAVTFIDEQIGRIVEALKRKGMYDNALICFVSDHGDMLGDHHMWRKTYAYEGSAAIPFIVKLPKQQPDVLQAGKVIDRPVELRDLLPTFLDIAGGIVPQKMDGLSLLPLMSQGESANWRKYIDIEHATCYWRENCWVALTDGKVKYIRFLLTGKEQLFDLTCDPGEVHDLSVNKKWRKQLVAMRQAMAEHLAERGEDWVKDGEIVVRKNSMLYSPNYPKAKK